ncbi:MAG TPA: hypothetical protein VNQ77_01790 [Frankiaceae bacterium]|nr:hypothetical protein [Frankiaceae bacterium]
MGTGEEPSFAERYGGVGVLIALVAVFGALRPSAFPTADNLLAVLGNEAVTGIVALGVLVPLAAGTADLSVGGMTTLAVVQVTWLFQATHGRMPVPVAVLVVLLTAVLAGLGNDLLVVRARLQPLVAALVTLGTGAVLGGVAHVLGDGETVSRDVPRSFRAWGDSAVLRVPVTAIVFAALAVLLWYVLARVPRERAVPFAYVASAVAAATAGIVLAARLGSGPPGAGAPYLLPAYAAAFLGAATVRPGRFTVGGLVVAVAILAVVVNGTQHLGAPYWTVDVVHGVGLVVGVLLWRRLGGTLLARK